MKNQEYYFEIKNFKVSSTNIKFKIPFKKFTNATIPDLIRNNIRIKKQEKSFRISSYSIIMIIWKLFLKPNYEYAKWVKYEWMDGSLIERKN